MLLNCCVRGRLGYSQICDASTAIGLLNISMDEILLHNGAIGGYRNVNPQKKFALVMPSNTTTTSVDGLGNDLMRWLETDR